MEMRMQANRGLLRSGSLDHFGSQIDPKMILTNKGCHNAESQSSVSKKGNQSTYFALSTAALLALSSSLGRDGRRCSVDGVVAWGRH
jgi:hypothetical protein